jgi:hypothetical protein
VSSFRVGVMDQIFNSRVSPTAAMRANYLGAVAAGADSFWVGDHVSSVFARSIATSQHGLKPTIRQNNPRPQEAMNNVGGIQ